MSEHERHYWTTAQGDVLWGDDGYRVECGGRITSPFLGVLACDTCHGRWNDPEVERAADAALAEGGGR